VQQGGSRLNTYVPGRRSRTIRIRSSSQSGLK
jgi:hypothetical protein